jgi:hypothetical protein
MPTLTSTEKGIMTAPASPDNRPFDAMENQHHLTGGGGNAVYIVIMRRLA